MAQRWVRQVLVFAVIGCTAAPALAQSCPEDAATVLNVAETKFNQLNFLNVLDILTACEVARWPEWRRDDRVHALRLMAISYYLTGEVALAEATVTGLLKADSGYEMRREDPHFFQEMVEAEKKVRRTRRRRKMIAGGLGGILGVVLGLLIGKTGDLPEPPLYPGN